MTDSIHTVNTLIVAESLAAISDNDDGFKPEVAAAIEADLRELALQRDLDPDAMHPGDAREVQDAWLAELAKAIA